MKIHLTIHYFVIASCILLCITPTTTLAQQEINTDTLTAKTDAEIHAKLDINKITWMGVGLCIPVVSVITGVVAAYAMGDTHGGGTGPAGYGVGDPSAIGFFGGAGLVCGISLFWLYSYEHNPPPERLLGKSPEYIEGYTTAYQKEMRLQRLKYAIFGTGCLFLGF